MNVSVVVRTQGTMWRPRLTALSDDDLVVGIALSFLTPNGIATLYFTTGAVALGVEPSSDRRRSRLRGNLRQDSGGAEHHVTRRTGPGGRSAN